MRLWIVAIVAVCALRGLAWADVPYPNVIIGGPVTAGTAQTADAEIKLTGKPDGDDVVRPEAELIWKGKSVGVLRAVDGNSAHFPAVASLVEMDPKNDTPELVLQSYTGDAECCTEIRVLTKDADGQWDVVDAGAFAGDPGLVDDADGDERYEIVATDPSFLYAFGCTDCSNAPLQILAIEGGEVRDVTIEPRFNDRNRQRLKEIEADMPPGKADNATLAGWVAQKYLLGEKEEAWGEMLLSYSKTDRFGLDFCSDGAEECPESRKAAKTFPEALKDLLDERGYAL